MALTILNNTAAISAENSLSTTQANLQKTLTQLSTGLRVNSGADDSAGLAIANGLQANIAALTQSSQNATNGVGQLQTADGALSQVSSLLDRAVTLTTEAANGGLTTGANSQSAALNTEFQSILAEINQIGQTTDFNGQNVFASSSLVTTPNSYTSTGTAALSASTALTAGSVTTIADPNAPGSGTFTFTAGNNSTVGDLLNAINQAFSSGASTAATANAARSTTIATTGAAATVADAAAASALAAKTAADATASANGATNAQIAAGVAADNAYTQAAASATSADTASTNAQAVAVSTNQSKLGAGASASIVNGKLVISESTNGSAITVGTTDSALTGFGATTSVSNSGANNNTVFISDGTQTGAANTQIQTTINALSAAALGLSGLDLTSTTNATTALSAVNAAVNTISGQRGAIGSSINRLQASINVETNQVQNLTTSSNSILDADVGKTVSNLTQYNILQSTGISALQQANQAQQGVLKLLQ